MRPVDIHFRWHSNPASKPLWKTFFDKCHVRPKVNTAWEVIKNPDATETQKADAWEVVRKLDQNHNQSNSAVMQGGKSVQHGCDQHFLENCPSQESIQASKRDFITYESRKWDNGSDKLKTALVASEIEQVTEQAILGLTEVFRGENRVIGEKEYLENVKGLGLKYFTIPDYCHRIDLKTKWSAPAETKSGKKAASLPRKLSGMYDMRNVYQAAGFKMCTGRDPVLVYANAKEFRIFDKHSCDELQPDFLDDVIEDIKKKLKAIEIKIHLAPNLMTLYFLAPPDLKSLAFPEPPGVIEEIENILGQINYSKTLTPSFEKVQDEYVKHSR